MMQKPVERPVQQGESATLRRRLALPGRRAAYRSIDQMFPKTQVKLRSRIKK
jgi:hypothetical protein